MNFATVLWFVGMVIFACVDVAILVIADICTLHFSLLWWFSIVLGAIAMGFSLYCKTAYISKRQKYPNKYTMDNIAIAFIGNFIIMLIFTKL